MRPPASGWGTTAAPWVQVYPAGVPSSYRYPTVPAGRLLDDAAQDFPDMVAVEYHRYRLTYRKLLDHADRLATALSALGVNAGDGLALVLPNCPQLIVALFASWRIGATVTLLTPSDPPTAVATTDPRVIVTLDRWYDGTIAPVRSTLRARTDVIVTGRDDYLPFPRNALSTLRRRRPVSDAENVLRFADLVRRSVPAPQEPTAAATRQGLAANGKAFSQRQLVVNSFQLRLWLPDVVAGDERFLLSVPLTSTLGAVWILTAVLSAATMILVDDARPAQRQRAAMRAKPTILPLDGDVTSDLLRSSWRRGHLRSVRIAVSSEQLDDRAIRHLEELTDKGRIRTAWGIGGLLTHADPVYGRAERGSVGLPLPDTDAVVAAADGTIAPLGTRGHLWVRGPQLCGTEWVDTRAQATLGADGYLVVHDHSDDGP